MRRIGAIVYLISFEKLELVYVDNKAIVDHKLHYNNYGDRSFCQINSTITENNAGESICAFIFTITRNAVTSVRSATVAA